MSELIITAAAWCPDQPKASVIVTGDQITYKWRILAEASVMDTDGKPVSNLTKSSWKIHVTDAQGGTDPAPSFSVAAIAQGPPHPPGFYLLTVTSISTMGGVMPTAFGIAIASKKLSLEGQVVVPIALAGPTFVSALTTPIF